MTVLLAFLQALEKHMRRIVVIRENLRRGVELIFDVPMVTAMPFAHFIDNKYDNMISLSSTTINYNTFHKTTDREILIFGTSQTKNRAARLPCEDATNSSLKMSTIVALRMLIVAS